MEIEPGVHQLTIGREPFAGFPPPNCFIVAGRERSILIDVGYDSEDDHRERMQAIASAKVPPVTELIITHRHPDHGGGAALMYQATGVPLACHPLDRKAIEDDRLKGRAPIGEEVSGGESRDLGGLTLQVLHGPGHTPGCLALYVPELGALFATDTVMAVSTTVLRPPEGNVRDYVRTLESFQQIDPKTIYTGHGGPVKDPQRRLRQLIQHREAREAELIKALAEPRTPRELREALYAGLPETRWDLAEAQVRTGLAKLIDDGVAREEEDGRYALA